MNGEPQDPRDPLGLMTPKPGAQGQQAVDPRDPLGLNKGARTPGVPGFAAESSASRLGSRPDPGSTERFFTGLGRSTEQGATFGFGDEANAGLRALFGGDTYSNALADERAKLARFRHEHPGYAIGSELAGGLAGGGLAGAGFKAGLRAIGLGGEALAAAGTAGAGTAAAAPVATATAAEATPIAARLGSVARNIVRGVPTAAAAGGVGAFGSAEGDVKNRIKAVPGGMAFGAGTAVGLKGAGAFGGGIRKLLPPQLGQALGGASAEEGAQADILNQLTREGKTLADVQATAAKASPETMLLDIGGNTLLRRARGAQSIPSQGSAQIGSALESRIAEQPGRVQSTVASAMTGQPRENPVLAARKMIAEQKANADPAYAKAEAAGPISSPVIDKTLDDPFFGPIFRRAYERGRRIGKGLNVDVPPLAEETTRLRMGDAPEGGAAPTTAAPTAPTAPEEPARTGVIRYKNGRLAKNLSNVPDEHLQNEYARLAEANNADEMGRAAILEHPARADYEALPSMEKKGRTTRKVDQFGNKLKRQAEDLPDAGGTMDPEQLLADNKTLAAYEKSKIVRANRTKAMDRIQAELDRRLPADAGDFEFGANAPTPAAGEQPSLRERLGFKPGEPITATGGAPPATPPPAAAPPADTPTAPRAYTTRGIDYMKRGLDDLIGSMMRSEGLGRAEASGLRSQMRGILAAADEANPDYAAARRQFAGEAELQKAHKRGRKFLTESHDEISADWPSMTDGEKALYRRGALSSISERLSKVTDKRDVTSLFQNPLIRQKLETILPDQQAAESFMQQLAHETAMHENARTVLSGSPTARIFAEQGDEGGGMSAKAAGHFLTGNWAGGAKQAIGIAAKKASGLTEGRVNALAPYLTARGSDLTARLQGLEQFANKPESPFRKLFQNVTRASGQVAGERSGSP